MAELNFDHLRYFRAIAHEQGLAWAVERLHVSPSALSRNFQLLLRKPLLHLGAHKLDVVLANEAVPHARWWSAARSRRSSAPTPSPRRGASRTRC